jgi:pilus assembly protein CpaB
MLKGKTPIVIAIVLGLVAALVYYYDRKMYHDELIETWEPQKVVVAAGNLDPGTTLDSTAVEEAEMPRKFVYESVLLPRDLEVALNREVIVPIEAGEPIHWYQLRGIRSLERLAKSVATGQRAVSIDVSERTSVGHWVRPNDAVDILGTFRDPGTNQMVTVNLLQQVKVLATGRTTGLTQGTAADTAYGTITVAVSPEDAKILVLGQELGTLSLVLRNADDGWTDDEGTKTTINTLLGIERRKRKKVIRKGPVIERGPEGAKRRR